LGGQTRKKVVIHRFEKTAVAGFCDPASGIDEQAVELLTPEGTAQTIPLADVKVLCFVKEFDGPGFDREQRTFRTRPKTEGLWLRMQFRDNDFLEGIAPNNLLQIDPAGVTVSPPEASSNITRIFAPKSALKDCRVLGVVGAVAARKRKAPPVDQRGLFD
jgi:hypothetical protein